MSPSDEDDGVTILAIEGNPTAEEEARLVAAVRALLAREGSPRPEEEESGWAAAARAEAVGLDPSLPGVTGSPARGVALQQGVPADRPGSGRADGWSAAT